MTTKSGLNLALTYIDSKLERIEAQYKSLNAEQFLSGEERRAALSRVYGADLALTQLRERIVRALGPDAE